MLREAVRKNKSALIHRCIQTYRERESYDHAPALESLFASGIESIVKTLQCHDSRCLDPFLKEVTDKVAGKEMRPSQGIKLINVLRDTLLELALGNQGKENATATVSGINHAFTSATERIMSRFESMFLQERDEVVQREKHIEELERKTIKFTSKKSRGWVDVGGTRMCLFDIPGGWSNMRNTINLFAGEETYRRVMFEMGLSETFTGKAMAEGVLESSPQGIRDAVDTFSEAGFGDFVISELSFPEGYARITCKDSFEGWSFIHTKNHIDSPACYYSAGVLLSFMQGITGRTDLRSAETRCIAKGDEACEFLIGTRAVLEQRGTPVTEWGMTIKERAEHLESILEEKTRMERELTRKYTELSALNKISARVNQSLDLEEIMNLAINELQQIAGEDKGIGIYLLDRKNNELVFSAQKGYPDKLFRCLSRLKIDEGLVGSAVKERIPIAYDDYPNCPLALRPVVEEAKVKSAMSVPLIAKDRIVGALSIASKTPYHFTSEEVNLMTLIGNQIGVAIENAQLLEEIKESERKYKALVEDINDGYIVCQDDKVIFANEAFCNMYGYGQEEVLGREVLDFFLHEASELIGSVSHDQAERRDIPGHFEFLRRHRDGSRLPTELKINFVEFDGKPAMIGIVRDISERKRMEQKVRESERLASIGQLAAAIAHEIRNPLSAIKMNVQILANNLKLQGFNKRRLEIAADEIKRLERIVEDVLDFAGPIQTRAVSASINEVIKQCLALLSDIIPKKNVRILRKWSRTLDPVLMDCEKMEQAFLNIMLNAFDAMPDGGVFEIVTGHGDHLGRRVVRAEFKDTGIGMRPDQIAKIFEPFYTTKTTGVGLGLPNARKIIEAHNGVIEVESAVSAGTTFRVFLPAE